VLSTEDGIWACTYIGTCTVVCPVNVDPAGAIQQEKLSTTTDWFRDVVMPWKGR
jgi:fumarate reductase iron-sulfur subunit